MKVKIKKFSHACIQNNDYATKGSSGIDLFSCIDAVLPAGSRLFVPTGISIEIPAGYEGQVRPRSGIARRHGVTVLNTPGTIDSDYRGEVCVILVNLGADDYNIRKGDRIAQLVICPIVRAELEFCEDSEFLSDSERGDRGFGSTGV